MLAVNIRTVPCAPWQIDGIWEAAKPFIAKSYARSDQTIPGSLLDDLRAERRLLWLVVLDYDKIVGAGVTAIFDLSSGKMLKIEHFGGEQMGKWINQISVIEEYAKAQGCFKVMIEGRIGWTRKLDDYAQTAVILEKRI
jgi:hypothetical protein